ncbi:MAG: hypothetical protein H7X97_10515, partial [Opitutaceae bacterium]|nr:hypothetical protein [Verrucomicrobiales bacterium]
VTFTVAVSGTSPTYQWRLNNTNLSGANGPSLVLNNVQFTNQGNYTVVVTNLLGALTNGPGTLRVLVSPYSFAGATKVGSSYGVTFNTDIGRTYIVKYKDVLDSLPWTLVLTNVVGNGSPAVITDPTATGPERYYRIETLFP